MSSLEGMFTPGEETKVTNPDGKVALVVSNVNENPPVPRPIALRCGGMHGLLRIAGSTATDATEHDQKQLMQFAEGMFGHGRLDRMVVMSGATRILNEAGRVVMSILELPTLIQRWNPSCITMGSAPRTTETLSYQGDHSTFIPSDKVGGNTLAHPGIGVFWSVQVTASQVSDWSGDLVSYFALMDLLRADSKATGLLVFGGGRVAAQEIRLAMERDHPVGVVKGSGRFADDLVAWKSGGVPSKSGREILAGWEAEGFDFSDYTALNHPAEGVEWLHSLRMLSCA